MSRWFRFHTHAFDNPKVLKLSDKDFRLWVRLLALAAKNDGRLPGSDDLKVVLRMRLDHLKGGLKRLISIGLIDVLEGSYTPHDWNEHQYKSDTSTERVKKFRKKRNVSETPPDTDTDTEYSVDKSTALDPEKVMFDHGVEFMTSMAVPPSKARSMLGKWKRDYGTGAVIEALGVAKREGAVDPIPYIDRVLEFRSRKKRTVNGDDDGWPCV